MNKTILILLLIPARVFCQFPETDIWMMNIKTEDGKIWFDHLNNITSKKGYENQPAYSKDSKTIYFTGQTDTSGKTDIYTYTIANEQVNQFTFSGTSEYSPTLMPKGNGLSVLMVEENGSQRIWEYPKPGEKAFPLFPKRDSIGYYAWINTHAVLAFILGDEKTIPERLSLIDGEGTERKIADSIGRGMKIFGDGALFIKTVDTVNYIYWTNYSKIKQLIKTPGNSQDIAIYEDYVFMAAGGTIYAAKMLTKNNRITGLEPFTALQDLAGYGLKKITRIAISPDKKTMAVVANMD